MKWRLIISLSLSCCAGLGQGNKNYIVDKHHDTIIVSEMKMNRKWEKVLCVRSGKTIMYNARELAAVQCDSVCYESGLVRSKWSKKPVFLKKIIGGKLSLYEHPDFKKEILWKNIGEDIIKLRWAYRAQDWSRKHAVKLYFYKKEDETNNHFTQNWRSKIGNCDKLSSKMNSKNEHWKPSPIEIVQYYNDNCN